MAILRLTSDAPTEYLRWPPSAVATGVAGAARDGDLAAAVAVT